MSGVAARVAARVAALALLGALVACAGQDEELLIPVAPVAGGGGSGGAPSGGGAAGAAGSGGDSGPACSVQSPTPASYTVQNTSATETFDLFWVDFGCVEQLLVSIAPGTPYSSASAGAGWVFRVRSKPNGDLVKEFVTQAGANQVTVP